MKKFLTIVGVLVLALTATTFAARAAQPQLDSVGVNSLASMPATPQMQSTPVPSTPSRRGMGMMGGGSSMMQGNMGGMSGGMMGGVPGAVQEHMNRMTDGAYNMLHEAMRVGATQMHDDVTRMLGMTAQDLYNQMAYGKSLVQLAAERGVTEQQLIDGIMTGRRAAFNQAVKEGRMTQLQADTMLKNMDSNLKMMVNAQGFASSGLGMMWDTQPSSGFGPFGMHR